MHTGLRQIQTHCELFPEKRKKKKKKKEKNMSEKGKNFDIKNGYKVAGRRLEAKYCFVRSCFSLSTKRDENRLDFSRPHPPPPPPPPPPPAPAPFHTGTQKDATAIFDFVCQRWIEIGPVIVRFPPAQACHCNNIMAGIMTSKPGCHTAIDALLSAERCARSAN